jgi:hypothetical protein
MVPEGSGARSPARLRSAHRRAHHRTAGIRADGQKPDSVKRYLRILADNALAGTKPAGPGKPTLYFRVDTPLDAVADARGIYGHVEVNAWKIEQQQLAYREQLALGKAKRRQKPEPEPEPDPFATPAPESYEDTWRDRNTIPPPEWAVPPG